MNEPYFIYKDSAGTRRYDTYSSTVYELLNNSDKFDKYFLCNRNIDDGELRILKTENNYALFLYPKILINEPRIVIETNDIEIIWKYATMLGEYKANK